MAATPSYYRDIQNNFRILDQIEAADGEMTQEVQDYFSLHELHIGETTAKMLEIRDLAVAQIAASELAIEREKAHIARNAASVHLLDKRFFEAVKQLGPLTHGSRQIRIKTTVASDVFDEDLIPVEYQRTVPEVPAVPAKQMPDKTKILAALRTGADIPGARKDEREKLEIK